MDWENLPARAITASCESTYPVKRGRPGPTFVRPAILEGVVALTSAGVAAVMVRAGSQIQCTALVEFGTLSAIAAASASMLLARYAGQIFGRLADYGKLEAWSTWLRSLSYLGLGFYALLNGVLDIVLPRRDSDPISYPGLLCAGIAVLVLTLVLESKYRVLQIVPSRSLLDSLSDDAFYVALGAITLGALAAHIFTPQWWLDTLVDALFVIIVAVRVRALFEVQALRAS